MKHGQVWIETVVYTLIGLSLIALVLALVTPKINEYKDRAIIEQSIGALNTIDATIQDVLTSPGNRRIVEYQMKRGTLAFDRENRSISYTLQESEVLYSEPGIETAIGRIRVLTTEGANSNTVRLSLYYPFNLTFDGTGSVMTYEAAATPYQFAIEHAGFSGSGITTREIIRISEITGG